MPHRCTCQPPCPPENSPCQQGERSTFLEEVSHNPMRMRRYKTTHSLLLSDRSAAAAAITGFLGAILTFALVSETEAWRMDLMAVFTLTFIGGLAIFNFRNQLSDSGVKPICGYVAEMGEDRRLTLSLPNASCPDCGERMTVRRWSPEGRCLDVWVCTSGDRDHRLLFDLTEFIKLAE